MKYVRSSDGRWHVVDVEDVIHLHRHCYQTKCGARLARSLPTAETPPGDVCLGCKPSA